MQNRLNVLGDEGANAVAPVTLAFRKRKIHETFL
jgi:hypothetical protein